MFCIARTINIILISKLNSDGNLQQTNYSIKQEQLQSTKGIIGLRFKVRRNAR